MVQGEHSEVLGGTSKSAPPSGQHRTWATSSWFQFRVLLSRSAKQQRGDVFNKVNMFQVLCITAIASMVWWQSKSVEDITGVIFFMNIQQSFSTMQAVIRVFPAERALLQRERSVGAYRMLPYFMAKSSSDLLATFLFPVCYATIIYWCVGLRPTAMAFSIFLCLFLASITVAQSLGLLVTVIIPDLALANCIQFVMVLFIMLFAGFYCDITNVPAVVQWVPNLSFMYWSYSGMIVNEFQDRDFSCSMARDYEYSTTCPFSGSDVITAMGFEGAAVEKSLGVLVGMALFCRVAAYLCLRFRVQLI